MLAGTERSVRRLDALREALGDDPADWLGPFMAGEGTAPPRPRPRKLKAVS